MLSAYYDPPVMYMDIYIYVSTVNTYVYSVYVRMYVCMDITVYAL